MKYYFVRKIFTVRSNLAINDERGKTRFRTTKGVTSMRGRINLVDADGSDAAVIRKKLISWGVAYDIERPSAPTATLREKWGLQRRYKLDLGSEGTIRVRPSMLRRRYRFVQDGKTIATAKIPWFSYRRRCTVDIAEDKYDALILASMIAIMKTDKDKAEKKVSKASDTEV